MRWFAAAILTAVLAGCGGEDGLTGTELAEQASAICNQYAQQGRELGRPDLADAQTAEEYFSAAADLAREQQEELEGLDPADDERADYEALTAVTEKSIVVLDDLAAAAAAEDDAKRMELVAQLPQLRTEVDDAAGRIGPEGAQDCAG